LLPGTHKIIARLKGHELVTREIVLGSEPKTRINFMLSPSGEFGDVKFLVSERDADVMVDRKRIGKSPIFGIKRLGKGEHQIVAIKPGFTNWTGTVSVTGGQRTQVDIQMIPEGDIQVELDDDGGDGSNIWPWVTTGVGVLAIGGGAVTGLMASSLHGKLEDKRAASEAIASVDIDTGKSLVSMTNLLLGVGTATVIGGLTWWFLDSPGVSASGDITTVFVPTDDGAVLSFGGRF
jgi:hypothetical protein